MILFYSKKQREVYFISSVGMETNKDLSSD